MGLFHYCSNNWAVFEGKEMGKASRIRGIRAAESGPEKAGVGGSIPSLATTFSIAYSPPNTGFHSTSFQNLWLAAMRFRSDVRANGMGLERPHLNLSGGAFRVSRSLGSSHFRASLEQGSA